MLRRILLATVLGVALVGCKEKRVEQERRAYEIKGDTALVHDTTYLAKRVVVSPVQSESYTREVVTAGTVQAIPTQYAYIAPPFSGRVVRSFVELGQRVAQNTPLFEISSSEFTSAQKDFFQAESERDLALNDLKRKKDLIINGVGSQRELEEAENALRVADKEYENALAALRVYQTEPTHMVLGQPLVVRSPLAGDVIENNIITGQYISSEGDPVAVVANLSKLWVAAQVKEKDIRFIQEGDDMSIHIAALPNQQIEGKVFHIDEAIDLDTRSIKVLSVIENREDLVKLGMYSTVTFSEKESQGLVVAEKAILQADEYNYVYRQLTPTTFIKTKVEVETIKSGKAIISQGLTAGDLIISEGGYYLK